MFDQCTLKNFKAHTGIFKSFFSVYVNTKQTNLREKCTIVLMYMHIPDHVLNDINQTKKTTHTERE